MTDLPTINLGDEWARFCVTDSALAATITVEVETLETNRVLGYDGIGQEYTDPLTVGDRVQLVRPCDRCDRHRMTCNDCMLRGYAVSAIPVGTATVAAIDGLTITLTDVEATTDE